MRLEIDFSAFSCRPSNIPIFDCHQYSIDKYVNYTMRIHLLDAAVLSARTRHLHIYPTAGRK